MLYEHKEFYKNVEEIIQENLDKGIPHREAIRQAITIIKNEHDRIREINGDLRTAYGSWVNCQENSYADQEYRMKYIVSYKEFAKNFEKVKDTLLDDLSFLEDLRMKAFDCYKQYLVDSISKLSKFDKSIIKNKQDLDNYIVKVQDILQEATEYVDTYNMENERFLNISKPEYMGDLEKHTENYTKLVELMNKLDAMPYGNINDANAVIESAKAFLSKATEYTFELDAPQK